VGEGPEAEELGIEVERLKFFPALFLAIAGEVNGGRFPLSFHLLLAWCALVMVTYANIAQSMNNTPRPDFYVV
jgi:hypothetical protein